MDNLGGVLIGFLVVGIVIAVGYVSKKANLITSNGEVILNRVSFFLMAPPLYVVVLSEADPQILQSAYFYATIIGTAITVAFVAIAIRLVSKRKHGIISSAMYSGATIFTNTSNIGIPLTLYVLGTTNYVAPVILIQVLVFSPALLILIELLTGQQKSIVQTVIKPFKNPIVIGSLVGTIMLLTGLKLPKFLYVPMDLLGKTSIPMLLLAFGVSIYGSRPLREPGLQRAEVFTSIVAKTLVMPIVSVLVGIWFFDISGYELFALALVSALPAGQTVYNFSMNYQILNTEIRDIVLVTTALAVPSAIVFTMLWA